MESRQLKFEKKNKNVDQVKSTVEYIAKTSHSKQDSVNRLSGILSDVKIGYGSDHVWCANLKNERLFIITGYSH